MLIFRLMFSCTAAWLAAVCSDILRAERLIDKMSEVIVVTSGKGGVGKTTTTSNIGAALSSLGKKVVLVDTDIGLRNLDLVMGLENRVVFNLVDVVEGNCKLESAIVKDKRFDGLFLLPAAQTKDKDSVNEEQMRKLCSELRKKFDYVILDCPAGIEQGFKNAVAGADRAVVVTTPEVSAVRDADKIIGMLNAYGVTEYKLLVNRVRIDMVKRGDMIGIEDIIDILGIQLIGVVPDDEAIIVSTNKGEPAVLNEKSRPAIAYKNVAKRIMGEDVPLMELEKSGIVSAIKRIFAKQGGR